MTSVLFVCTGNVFRSVTAEYALRAALGPGSPVSAASAGTCDASEASIRPDVAAYLATKGLAVGGHRRRTVTRRLLDSADRVIAMSTDHQLTLRERFDVHAKLFTEACGDAAQPLADVDELFAAADCYSVAAQRYIYSIIDRIIALTPGLKDDLERCIR